MGRPHASADAAGYGTAGYDGHPASLADYLAQVDDPSRGDHERFKDVKQPVYIRDNVYAAGAGAYEAERDPLVLDDADVVAVVDEGDEVYLETQLPEAFDTARIGLITGSDLERVRFVDAEFEEPDGSPARLDTDLVGARKTGGQTYPAGPIATLASGSSRTRVWCTVTCWVRWAVLGPGRIARRFATQLPHSEFGTLRASAAPIPIAPAPSPRSSGWVPTR